MGVLQPADAGGMAGAVGEARIRFTAAGPRARRCVLVALVALLAVLAGCGEDGSEGRGRRGSTRTASRRSSARSPSTRAIGRCGWRRTPACSASRAAGHPRAGTGTLTTPKGSGRSPSSSSCTSRARTSCWARVTLRRAHATLPPLLGLIRSTDAGQDLDVGLPAQRRRLPRDRALRRLLVGSQFGLAQILRQPRRPRELVHRAPRRARSSTSSSTPRRGRWIASAAESISAREDGAAPGAPIDPTPNSRFAWPAPRRPLPARPRRPAEVQRGRRRFMAGPRVDGGRAAGTRRRGPETLYALLLDGTVKRSEDGGRTWSVLVAPPRGG